MSVTDVRKDHERLTMTITSEFDAPVERVWQVWEDPRQLERWWGPPTYPATFVEHHLTPGGTCLYYMTGPDGEQPRGWWRITSVQAPTHLEFEDGFADEEWNPVEEFPSTIARVTLAPKPGGGTRMVVESVFPSTKAMEQILSMGAEEGFTQSLGQIDDLLEQGAGTG